jgi:uncharacterized transporter YbjL
MMQRTFADDLRWASFVLLGAVIGLLVVGGGDASLLLGSVAGVLVAIVVLTVLRRSRRGP